MGQNTSRAFHRSRAIVTAIANALLAQAQGLDLLRDVAMPSNNRTLIWQRRV